MRGNIVAGFIGALIALALLGGCGGTMIAAVVPTAVAQNEPIPPTEDLVSISNDGKVVRMVDRKGDAVCWIAHETLTNWDRSGTPRTSTVAISCLPIQQLRGNYDR